MANVPQAGHPIRLPPWRVEVAQPDGTSGYMLPPATNPYDWRGQAVRSPLHLPAAMTPHLFGLMRGQEAPLFQSWIDPDYEGVQFKLRFDFGADGLDWRFAYKNKGAAPSA